MGRVHYKRIIEGKTSPAIIKDGGYYYYNMPVYEDGTIDCWHMSSLSELKTELANDWLVTKIPIGGILNIIYLGAFKILDARWKSDTLNYYIHIRNIVRQMNPEMLGLYKEPAPKKEFWDNRGVVFSAEGIPYKVLGLVGDTLELGSSFDIFCRAGVKWRLTSLTVFEDESIEIDAIENKTFTFEEIKKLFDNNILATSFINPTWVTIEELGEVYLETKVYAKSSSEKLESIVDIIKMLNPQSDIADRLKKLRIESEAKKKTVEKRVTKKDSLKKDDDKTSTKSQKTYKTGAKKTKSINLQKAKKRKNTPEHKSDANADK